MSESRHYLEIHCRACSHREVCGEASLLRLLQAAGKVRPASHPEPDILRELAIASANRLRCPDCGSEGLQVGPADDPNVEWPDVVLCEACDKPIPRERVEALPHVKLCAGCQGKLERGEEPGGALDYCPRCGAPMELRLARDGGITRYIAVCTNRPPCRR